MFCCHLINTIRGQANRPEPISLIFYIYFRLHNLLVSSHIALETPYDLSAFHTAQASFQRAEKYMQPEADSPTSRVHAALLLRAMSWVHCSGCCPMSTAYKYVIIFWIFLKLKARAHHTGLLEVYVSRTPESSVVCLSTAHEGFSESLDTPENQISQTP